MTKLLHWTEWTRRLTLIELIRRWKHALVELSRIHLTGELLWHMTSIRRMALLRRISLTETIHLARHHVLVLDTVRRLANLSTCHELIRRRLHVCQE